MHLCADLPRCCRSSQFLFCKKKILPTLLDELGQDESLVGPVLANILDIGKTLSQLSFSTRILPFLKKLKDYPAGQIVILERMDVVRSRVNGREFKEGIAIRFFIRFV